jgi:hypothetical protein
MCEGAGADSPTAQKIAAKRAIFLRRLAQIKNIEMKVGGF